MIKQKIAPFLTFNGQAEQAMKFYCECIKGAKVTHLQKYGKREMAKSEKEQDFVLQGAIEVLGQEILFLDMTSEYPAPAFNWANSLLIRCESQSEFDAILNGLSKEGTIMMGPQSVEGIRQCAWLTDKFGVVWQPVWA
ncbi:MAG: VOC family protein [Clostridiales bacterium]|jgi:predicted 3-demethylubiquinone-9 3-methyltransferase (glyoxalase superfamily)|nr:VOC family protein [Clostridiales bacterium]